MLIHTHPNSTQHPLVNIVPQTNVNFTPIWGIWIQGNCSKYTRILNFIISVILNTSYHEILRFKFYQFSKQRKKTLCQCKHSEYPSLNNETNTFRFRLEQNVDIGDRKTEGRFPSQTRNPLLPLHPPKKCVLTHLLSNMSLYAGN